MERDGKMIQLYDEARGTLIGNVSETDFQFLSDQLEEESSEDHNYYISAPTIDMLEESGADPALVEMLRTALGGREGFEIRWTHG